MVAGEFTNQSLVLEYQKVSSDQLNQTINQFSSILIPSYIRNEIEFAKAMPEEVANDFMLKSLFQNLSTDPKETNWVEFEQKVTDVLNNFFKTMDWGKHSDQQDKHIFVTIKNTSTNKLTGVIQFLSTPKFAKNHVKAALYGITPEFIGSKLELILMSSIFKINTQTQRILVHTRSTNQQAISNYINWGFKHLPSQSPSWSELEYLSDQSDYLQTAAAKTIISK